MLLEKESLNADIDFQFICELDRFVLHALVRAVLEIPGVFSEKSRQKIADNLLVLYSKKDFRDIENEPYKIHPWQLWVYNIGILAFKNGQKDLAVSAWNKSIDLCHKGGETMEVMALLPLAQIYESGNFKKAHQAHFSLIINLIRKSENLNQVHFRKIMASENYEIGLKEIHCDTARYFPFYYR